MQPSTYPLCRHIKPNGRRCQSPAYATGAFCFHHHKLHRPRRPFTVDPATGLSARVLQSLGSRDSIQRALSLVASGLCQGHITRLQARQLLSAIKLAMANLSATEAESRS